MCTQISWLAKEKKEKKRKNKQNKNVNKQKKNKKNLHPTSAKMNPNLMSGVYVNFRF